MDYYSGEVLPMLFQSGGVLVLGCHSPGPCIELGTLANSQRSIVVALQDLSPVWWAIQVK